MMSQICDPFDLLLQITRHIGPVFPTVGFGK
jgi:hypothetical protein